MTSSRSPLPTHDALIIVESPKKIPTLKKILGDKYLFTASVGHIIDLPPKQLGIDTNTFEVTYEPMSDKKKVISELKKMAKQCKIVYICTDPDREGEAIAWHIQSVLPPKTEMKRVVFHSITKQEVLNAIQNPIEIDLPLVNAQQTRRILDRLVGYKLSPILQRKIKKAKKDGKKGLSAGRVQSVALKLVVLREEERDRFESIEHYQIHAEFKTGGDQTFDTRLQQIGNDKIIPTPKKMDDVRIKTQSDADIIVNDIQSQNYAISNVERKHNKRYPVPPFTTSTLQQEASRYFGFNSSRTMRVAQSLYEGVQLKSGEREGLVTYIRTDSTRIAPEVMPPTRAFISDKYGDKYLSEKPVYYRPKKAAQDAHECIRPSSMRHTPQSVASYLDADQAKLYGLIWRRFVSSQMSPAEYDKTLIHVSGGDYLFQANGSILTFSGFLKVYEERNDDTSNADTDAFLPNVNTGDDASIGDVESKQQFTQPPPRYTEASLVKELTKSGIGRPSTYAPIMNKIQDRDYTVREKKFLIPTDLGKVVIAFLDANFDLIMNTNFTVNMEDNLELIAENKMNKEVLLSDFWKELKPLIDKTTKDAILPTIKTDISCPKCKTGKLQKVWGAGGHFYGCTNYPDCDFQESISAFHFDKSEYDPNFDWEQSCPQCQSSMVVRHGPYGVFLGCTNYPDCRGIVPVLKAGETQKERIACVAKGCEGHLTERKSKWGKSFLSCSNFPQCDVIGNSLDAIKEKYHDRPKTAYKKKTTSGALNLKEPLKGIVGECKTNGQVTKNIWKYIKEQDLQDPEDKRYIRADDKLKPIFDGEDRIHMFHLSRYLQKFM